MRSFEVDTPKTLAIKREVLKKAGIDPAGVTFVSRRLREGGLAQPAGGSGIRPQQTGPIPVGGRDPVPGQGSRRGHAAQDRRHRQGSVIAFDYFTTEVLESQALYLRIVRASLRAGGEPLKFGIDSTPPSSERLAELLRSCGLSLGEQHTVGQETEGKRALGGFATAIVK